MMRKLALGLRTLLIGLAIAGSNSAHSQSYLLDDFEDPSIRVVQPTYPRYLWSISEGVGTGPTTLAKNEKHDGAQSIKSVFTGGDWQWHVYTYTEGLSGFSNDWQFVRKFVKNPSTWQLGKVNRLKFWIKLPPGIVAYKDGEPNFHFGTFIRCSTCTGDESDNGHFYHYYNLETTGQWEQIIVDTIPDHQRSGNANLDQPDRLFVTNEPNFTYFDAMVRFYLDIPWNQGGVPLNSAFYMDGFQFYVETNPENIEQIRSMHASYDPVLNRVAVGWNRKKSETTVKHEVRYAFTDIFQSGWDAATPAPSGTITPPSTETGYNAMWWSSTAIPLAGKTNLYVAIKPQNSNRFRQIVIPLTGSAGGPVPMAPASLQVR
jgi:hypothetical protein